MKFYNRDLEEAYNTCEEIMQIMFDKPDVTARVINVIKSIASADSEMEDMHYEIKNSYRCL